MSRVFARFALVFLALCSALTPAAAQGGTGNAPASSGNPPAEAATYTIDPAHSSINFSVPHLVINVVRGRFTDFAGTIVYDARDVTQSSVQFTAKTASVNTDVPKRDEHLRTPDFFDVAKYPELSFKSTRVEKRGDAYECVGTFTLHGVSKEITIPFRLAGPIKDPWGNARIGVGAEITINRQDYGIAFGQTVDGGGLVVGNDVKIELNLEAMNAPKKSA